MGAALEAFNPFAYDHWMPDEEPTFYIPRDLNLTPQQSEELQRAGIRQGEPFILTRDGRLTRPESRTTSLRGYYDCFNIQSGTAQMFEEEAGKYSFEFKYFTPMPVSIEVYINSTDASDSTTIKMGRTAAKWGPFSLPASPHIPPLSTAVDAGYKKWSSKRYNLQPLNTPALVEESQLPTVSNQGAMQSSAHDIVLVVTPRYPTAAPLPTSTSSNSSSSVRSPPAFTSTHLSPRQIELETAGSGNIKHTGRGYQRVLPVESTEQLMVRNNSSMTGHYELVTVNSGSHQGAQQPPQRRTQPVHTVSVRAEQTTPPGNSAIPANAAKGNNANIDPTQWVKKEAFFFRVNYDSFQKRHAVTRPAQGPQTTKPNTTGSKIIISIGDQAANRPEKSADKAEHSVEHCAIAAGRVATSAISSGVFMRSKAVCLDCALQLLQIDNGEVYSRLTLYGIEGFRFPIWDVSGTHSSVPEQATVSVRMENTQSQELTDVFVPTVEPSSILAPAPVPRVQSIPAASPAQSSTAVTAPGAECIICLSSPQTTIMFPCRHLCLCDQCASEMATRATGAADHNTEKKCPVCRRPVIVMFQLKVR